MPRAPKPGGVTIEPRSFTDNPRKFGETSTRLTVGPVTSPHQGAAELQHALSNSIREYLLDRGLDLRTFCASATLPAGLTYERFYRISNGTTMMGLTDLIFWATLIPDFAETLNAAIARVTESTLDPAG
jgi:hypothetical protein